MKYESLFFLSASPMLYFENNESQIIQHFKESAERGDVNAQYNLGIAYSNGKDVQLDHIKAVEWFRKAAEQGHDLAALFQRLCD